MGSALGAARTAAKRVGCTVEEWLQHRADGERWCSTCRKWWFVENMGPSAGRPDGVASACRACTAGRFQARREALGGDNLDHVVIGNLRELIAEHHLTHEDLASAMQAQGLSHWTRNRVAQTVTLRRSLTLTEIVGVCMVFKVPMGRLLKGDDRFVLLGGVAIAMPGVRSVLL
jgi:hypothetical protein